MKVALLLSGEPRFCTHFDQFISNIINYDSLEFFFYLWRKSPIELSDKRWNLVADFWRDVDEEKSKEKIIQNLNDPKYRVIDIKFENRETFIEPEIKTKSKETNVLNVWQMHNAWFEVDKLKRTYEFNNNFKYDLVINGRFDIVLNRPLDLAELIKKIRNKIIFTPDTPLHGYQGHRLNDCLCIGDSDTVSTYMQVVKNELEYNQNGLLFHPETLLSHHLRQCKIQNIKTDFDFELRKGYVKKVYYTSDFGRWA